MTNLHIVPISLFLASILFISISIFMMIFYNGRYCADKEDIGWIAFLLFLFSFLVNIFLVIPHYEEKENNGRYCKSVKRGSDEYYLNCAPKVALCQAYDNGILVRNYTYCQTCVPMKISLELEGNQHTEVINPNYQKCFDKYSNI